jgi:hypothetical protein
MERKPGLGFFMVLGIVFLSVMGLLSGANAKSLSSPPGVEIPYAGEVPLPPNVRPVIILSGSDYEMGFHFYQQLIQIFGPWILERVADDKFSAEEAKVKKPLSNIPNSTPLNLSICSRAWQTGQRPVVFPCPPTRCWHISSGERPKESDHPRIAAVLPPGVRYQKWQADLPWEYGSRVNF